MGWLAASLEDETTTQDLYLERCLSICGLDTPKCRSSQSLQSPMHGSRLRVAYHGSSGAYSEVAVAEAYPQSQPIPCQEFEAAFLAVESWLADVAVLPIENTLDGSIHRNYDLLLRHKLHIIGELQWSVQHCLLTLPGVKKEELKKVVSHPQALSQCRQTILDMGLDVALESVDDAASAAHLLATNNVRDTAAIASVKAAEIFGLDVFAKGIQENPDNITRFLTLARKPIVPTGEGPYKTTVVFALEDGPGALYKALSAFAFREIKVAKLESRPCGERPVRVVQKGDNSIALYFNYVFFLDIEASLASSKVRNALKQVSELSSIFRILGSYPMDRNPVAIKTRDLHLQFDLSCAAIPPQFD